LQGKELSYNNYLDLDAAWQAVRDLEAPAAVMVKHTTPCGAASARTPAAAYRQAYQGDPLSAFGGVLGCNQPVDAETAQEIGALFLECIVAPGFTPDARMILARKKDCRLLVVESGQRDAWDYRRIGGGVLLQQSDATDSADWRVVTRRHPTTHELQALRFAWRMVRHVKSNAIVLAIGEALVGVGGGQTSRVDAVEMALKKAAGRAQGSALASDAFFPFRDCMDAAAQGGVTAVVQPGGSIRDAEVIAAADQAGITMAFTGVRHFRH
jgi:phosphoribosylaminoimidazolecarboxamide formyltransferase/IMP cyclohydrolase